MVYVEATTDLQKDFIPFLFFLGKNEICCNFSNPFKHGELVQLAGGWTGGLAHSTFFDQ